MLYQVTDWDDAYVNGGYIANADSYPPRWAEAAAAFRAAHPSERTGEGGRQGHLFRPAGAAKGLMVFIHGGYWLRFHPDDWSHLAAGALAAGWACLMPGYRLAPEARIAEMAREVAAQIADVAGHVAGPIAICGHSAGGHLAARMVCAGGPLPEAVAARVTACLPISPLTDLRALMRTKMNETLRIDAAEAAAESPAMLEPREGFPVTAWVGGAERPEFLRHARLLADAWAGCGVPTRLVVDPGRHHFDVIDPLAQPGSAMLRCLLKGVSP